MKRIFLFTVLISIVGTLWADITGDGYYRVKNYSTERWASLIDDDCRYVDLVSAEVDLHALQLNSKTDEILTDPGSIVYIKNLEGNKYDVSSQGVSLESLVDFPIYLYKDGSANGESLYRISGIYKGVTKYISDGEYHKDVEYGIPTVNDLANDLKKWYFKPVDVTGDNYFGVKPQINIGGNLYATLYASFPFESYSQGMEVYYIGRASQGVAELKEINGIVPAGTPVLIKCVGQNPGDNRLKIVGSNTTIQGNSLVGVYFNYKDSESSNQVAYNSSTMRILGQTSDGSLGFVKTTLDYVPHNTAYLTVAAGSPSEFRCVPSENYDEALIAGVESIESPSFDLSYKNSILYSSSEIVVVNMEGQTVLKSNEGYADVSKLQKGVYVAVSGGKTIKFIR